MFNGSYRYHFGTASVGVWKDGAQTFWSIPRERFLNLFRTTRLAEYNDRLFESLASRTRPIAELSSLGIGLPAFKGQGVHYLFMIRPEAKGERAAAGLRDYPSIAKKCDGDQMVPHGGTALFASPEDCDHFNLEGELVIAVNPWGEVIYVYLGMENFNAGMNFSKTGGEGLAQQDFPLLGAAKDQVGLMVASHLGFGIPDGQVIPADDLEFAFEVPGVLDKATNTIGNQRAKEKPGQRGNQDLPFIGRKFMHGGNGKEPNGCHISTGVRLDLDLVRGAFPTDAEAVLTYAGVELRCSLAHLPKLPELGEEALP